MSVATSTPATGDKAQFDAEFDEARTDHDHVEEVDATICFITTVVCPGSCEHTHVA